MVAVERLDRLRTPPAGSRRRRSDPVGERDGMRVGTGASCRLPRCRSADVEHAAGHVRRRASTAGASWASMSRGGGPGAQRSSRRRILLVSRATKSSIPRPGCARRRAPGTQRRWSTWAMMLPSSVFSTSASMSRRWISALMSTVRNSWNPGRPGTEQQVQIDSLEQCGHVDQLHQCIEVDRGRAAVDVHLRAISEPHPRRPVPRARSRRHGPPTRSRRPSTQLPRRRSGRPAG